MSTYFWLYILYTGLSQSSEIYCKVLVQQPGHQSKANKWKGFYIPQCPWLQAKEPQCHLLLIHVTASRPVMDCVHLLVVGWIFSAAKTKMLKGMTNYLPCHPVYQHAFTLCLAFFQTCSVFFIYFLSANGRVP